MAVIPGPALMRATRAPEKGKGLERASLRMQGGS